MQAGPAHDLEQQQFALGSGRVRLRHLRFETGIRDFDEKNVDRLKLVFSTEGCHRENPINFVPALISKADLEQSSNIRGHSVEISLPPDRILLCLHGKHRILAAKAVLPLHDQWWTIAFYDEDMPHATRESMIQHYANELRFSDGDVFRFYRRAQQANDQKLVNRWLARLSASKKRNLMQLEKADHGRLIATLDAFIPFVGLWQDFQLGAMNRILPMRTWQELSTYLSRMLRFWSSVMEGFEACELTPHTVQELQLRAPMYSLADAETIRKALKLTQGSYGPHTRYKLFPRLSEPAQREIVLRRLLPCPRILSFHSFFQDTIYLAACHDSMRTLLPSRRAYHDSFEAAFRGIFAELGTPFRETYLQLWLYTMRHTSELSGSVAGQARKDSGQKKPSKSMVKASRVDAFAAFARVLGYDIVKEEHEYENVAETTDPDVGVALSKPALSTDLVDVPLRARCNRPFERSFVSDRKYMFPKYILAKDFQEQCQYVTTFAIARDIAHTFWDVSKYGSGDGITEQASVRHSVCQTEVMPLSELRQMDRVMMTPPEISVDEMDISPQIWNTAENRQQADHREACVSELGNTDMVPTSHSNVVAEQDATSQGDLTRDSTERQEAEADLYEEDVASIIADSSSITRPVAVPAQSTSARKRKPDAPINEANRVMDRDLTMIERSRQALEGRRDAWCVVDAGLQCHIRTGLDLPDMQKLDDVLNNCAKAFHYLRLYQNSSGRTLTVSRGHESATAFRALQSEQPYRILLVTPRSTTRWDYVFVYVEGAQNILAWQRTGDPDCRKLVLIQGQTEEIIWERSIHVQTVSGPQNGIQHERTAQTESDAAYHQRLDRERSGWSEITVVFDRMTNPTQVSFQCENDDWDQFLADKNDFIWEEL